MNERYARYVDFQKDMTPLRGMRVLVVGVGGLGVVVLDTLARLGVGTLEFFDLDTLEVANLNRAIFLQEQVGKRKVDAMTEYLQRVNPDIELVPRFGDVTDDAYRSFEEGLGKADVLVGCVDTPHARVFMNKMAVKAMKPYIDGGAREDGLNGAVQTVIPGITPCYRCNKPVFTINPKESSGENRGMCFATSLPTTMGIIASLQSQEVLRLLLGAGEPIPLLIYRGMEGTVEKVPLSKDPSCDTCGGLS